MRFTRAILYAVSIQAMTVLAASRLFPSATYRDCVVVGICVDSILLLSYRRAKDMG
jgi:hypothetical protein